MKALGIDKYEIQSEFRNKKGNSPKGKALNNKKGGLNYDGMMKDIYKSFPNIKLNGKSPYKDKHKK